MSDPTSVVSALHRSPARYLPWLLLLFVGSGCAALIYEIVWFQLLQLVIGSSAVSLGVLLGTYMGGMCLGSLLLPQLLSPRLSPLRVYALLEFGIGIVALLVLFGMPLVSRFYAEHGGPGPVGILWRGALCAILLLPPTLLMGATLPAIARWVEATPQGVSWLGFFYGGNLVGAVCGCLLAGFYLLRVSDVVTATWVAVAMNGMVALLGLTLADRSQSDLAGHAGAASPKMMSAPVRGSKAVYLAVALSGLTALAAEVIWTRLLSLLLGGTVYTFSLILSVFLTGLGLGSSAGAALARGSASPRLLLGTCQGLLALAIAWAGFQLTRSLPFWPVDPYLTTNPSFLLQLDLLRCAWALLPAACMWGATFPLALAAVASGDQDPGRSVGRVYAANTLGAIVGAVVTSVLLIGWMGTQHVQQGLIAFSLLNGLILLTPEVWRRSEGTVTPRRFKAAVATVAVVAAAVPLIQTIGPVPWQLVAYGRSISTMNYDSQPLYLGEGMNASVAVTEMPAGERSFHISGKVEASSLPEDMRLQRLLGHLPALFHPAPKSVLVVGCGAGVTAGSFVLHPGVERIVICELEPLIPRVVAEYFGKENYHVVRDPRVQVVYDDARHYLLTTSEKFDLITSDPIHPWVKGAATLYTTEYFELCRRRLKPGGLVSQWVPLYESTLDTVKSELATFFQVFPSGTLWSNHNAAGGYDVVLLGQAEPLTLNVDRLQTRLERPDYRRIKASLQEVGLPSSSLLLTAYLGRAIDLRSWLANAEINRDSNLRLQYLAGMGLNTQRGSAIYDTLLPHRRFPSGLMVGSTRLLRPLRHALQPAASNGVPWEGLDPLGWGVF